MKVLMLSDSYPPIIGGMGTQVQALSKELNKRGHEVVICTMKYRKEQERPSPERENGLEVNRLWSFSQRIPLLYRNPNIRCHPPFQDWIITNRLRTIVEKLNPDVIHAQGWIIYSILPLITKYDIPMIVTLHDYGLICPKRTPLKMCTQPLTSKCISCAKEEFGAKSLLVYLAYKINWPKVRQIDKFISISSFQRSVYLKSLGLNDKDIIVIPNAVDLEKFSPSACTSQLIMKYEKDLGVKLNSNKIVCVSRLSSDKVSAVLNVVNATPKIVEEFPNTQLLLVGDGEFFDYINGLAEKINRRLNKVAIILTGGLEEEEMPRIIGLADIVIGVGRVSLEAMACGKPVIVAGSLIGPFGGNYGGVITPNSVSELRAHNFSGRNSSERTTPHKIAEDCVRLLADNLYRLSLGSFGREYAEKECNIRKIVKQVEAVYFQAINGRVK